ncbi:hypothetical protein EHP00_1564 [Ecytonucleospora hepatopenaei]|uniref:Uncharacterized protein n=1 Tax=Ecytonucleospora hepatopenaei TaxID=646526 RepID=A0A1W0E6X6_9MICR|nr:hypothetical protein EHP00_1564 [Ecytonucleospora hepatopenaei]
MTFHIPDASAIFAPAFRDALAMFIIAISKLPKKYDPSLLSSAAATKFTKLNNIKIETFFVLN